MMISMTQMRTIAVNAARSIISHNDRGFSGFSSTEEKSPGVVDPSSRGT